MFVFLWIYCVIASISSTGLVTGQKEGKTTAIVTKADTGTTSIANVTVLPAGVEIEPMALTCMSHTVVLKANGTVWAYGLNSSPVLDILAIPLFPML